MTEKSKCVDYEMKYIGWNIGATRVERHETKGGIEILELKIDGVDVLKQLEKAEKLDAIETLMRGQHYINVNVMGQYSVLPELSHRGTKLVSAIMAILFPDDPDEER